MVKENHAAATAADGLGRFLSLDIAIASAESKTNIRLIYLFIFFLKKSDLMELRGQDKEIGMPSSLVYHRESSSTPINSAVEESRSDAILNQPQALDQQHPPLYNQLNPHPGINHNKPRRDPELDKDHPDPVPPSIIATTSATTNRSNLKSPATAQAQPLQQTSAATAITTLPLVRYRECLKNHAANMGGLVMDGCGEFMPSGEEGTIEGLKCAACECHRNFHRKEIDGEAQYASNSYYNYNNPHRNNISQRNMISHHHPHPHQLHPPQMPPLQQHHRFSYASPSTVAPMMMNFGGGGSSGGGAAESSSEDLNMYQSNALGQTSVQPPSSKKRFRTKFSQEQKDRMLEFAEKLGWKLQKQDEEEVQQFCAQVGVKRQVFKVWMHNNKQATKKKQM